MHLTHRARLLAGLLVIFVLPGLVISSAAADGPEPPADCGCHATGAYAAPIRPVAPYVSPAGGSAADAPRYTATVNGAPGGPQSVTVTRTADQAALGTYPLANAVSWGFSPDQDRFVIASDPGSVVSLTVLDLTRTPMQLYSGSMSQEEIRVGFSPHGEFIVTSLRGGANVGFSLYRVTDGYTFRGGVSTTVAEPTGWWDLPSGFSGDDDEFVAVYAGATPDQRRYRRFDLTTGIAQTSTETLPVPAASQLLFSPCGEMLAQVDPGAAPRVTLTNVATGEQVASRTFAGPVELAVTTVAHVAIAEGVSTELAPATDHCPPTWAAGAALEVTDLTPQSVTLEWPAASDDTAVTGYRVVNRQGVPFAQTGALATTIVGLPPETTFSFRVEARDAAGSWGVGPSVEVTTPVLAPAWPDAAVLAVSEVGARGATVSWPAALEGSRAFAGYQVSVSPGGVLDVPAGTTTVTLTGLVPATAHRIVVVARDADGHAGAALEGTLTTAAAPAAPAPLSPQLAAPGAVTGLRAAALRSGRVRLSWTGTPAATAYVVQVRRSRSGAWRTVRQQPGTVAVLRAPAGRTVWLRVIPVNAVGEGPASAVVRARARR